MSATNAHTPVAPRWIRPALTGPDLDSAVFAAGAALAVLDPLAQSDAPVTTLWRHRLSLAAAVTVAGLEGRREGEADLRDGFALRRADEEPGPAGRLLLGWRWLGEARALRSADWPQRLPAFFDLPEQPFADLLATLGGRLPGRVLPLRHAAGVAAEALTAGPAARGLALWLGDAALARALGWGRPLPLLAAHLPRAALRLEGEAWLAACAAAWGRGALAAIALHADLDRRAAALTAAAPRLRGRDSAAVVAALLREDAIAAQAGEKASDRAARRIFDRLTMLGLVRELTGRPTFRLYGL